ncbi:MAG: MarR family transcriptional regulator [Crocinitomicaceae bacterium]|jgi:MarR family transcriptional regulator, 2-MHQ and catechol-resistance regulon repressor|nr:MarR family transcriptional regulator [Crocinitomicaceae bacterium]
MKIEDEIQTRFKTPQQKAIINIRYTSNFLGNIQNSLMDQYGLSMAQFNILRILRGAKSAINVQTVKERMIEKSPNTTRLMDKLIEKELIERTRCTKDRRVVYVEISKDGLAILKAIDDNSDILNMIQVGLSDEESTILSDLLDKVRNHYHKK